MGLVCDLDEAHRALGDLLPVILSSRNYLTAKGQAFLSSYSAAQTEGPLAAARALVLRQATHRFGERPGSADTLAALTRDGELRSFRHDGFWQPMDTLRDKTILEGLWASGKAPWKMWA